MSSSSLHGRHVLIIGPALQALAQGPLEGAHLVLGVLDRLLGVGAAASRAWAGAGAGVTSDRASHARSAAVLQPAFSRHAIESTVAFSHACAQ